VQWPSKCQNHRSENHPPLTFARSASEARIGTLGQVRSAPQLDLEDLPGSRPSEPYLEERLRPLAYLPKVLSPSPPHRFESHGHANA
jgi:hypothetical protein